MNKKKRESFVFYKDWWNTLKDVDDKVRLEVLDALMNKVFDDKTVKVSAIARIALSFIMTQIERDLTKYTEICEKRREAVEKRWSKSKNTKEYKSIQPNTNDTYNDNDNVNDNENENDSIIKEEIKEENFLLSEVEFAKKLIDELLVSEIWKDNVCMQFNKKKEEIDSRIREFGLHIQTNDSIPTDLGNAKRYFINWLRIREQDEKKVRPQTAQVTQEQEEQRLRESEQRHQQFLRNKANAIPMPEELKKRLGL